MSVRCKRREQPLALTPALWAKGRIRWVLLRYCGSCTLISPKVVCQRSFFTLAVCSSAVAYFFFGLAHLALGPGLQGVSAQAAYFLDQPVFGVIRAPELLARALRQRQQ